MIGAAVFQLVFGVAVVAVLVGCVLIVHDVITTARHAREYDRFIDARERELQRARDVTGRVQ